MILLERMLRAALIHSVSSRAGFKACKLERNVIAKMLELKIMKSQTKWALPIVSPRKRRARSDSMITKNETSCLCVIPIQFFMDKCVEALEDGTTFSTWDVDSVHWQI